MRKIKVNQNNNSCILRWAYKGTIYTITHGTYGDKTSMALMEKIAAEIFADCTLGTFDTSLEKYKKWKSTKKEVKQVKSLLELWNLWIESKGISETAFHENYLALQKQIERCKPELNDASWLSDSDLSPSTYNKKLRTIRACFNWGIKKRLIESNPFDSVKSKKINASNSDPFSKREVKEILYAIGENLNCKKTKGTPYSYYYPFFAFLFATGLRPREVAALRWESIDWENNRIHIKEAFGREYVNGKYYQVRKTTKTGNKWFIPLSDTLKHILAQAGEQVCGNCIPSNSVFLTPNGKNIDWDKLNRDVWKPVLNDLGIRYRTPYQIRHTVLSSAAMDPKIGLLGAAKLAGHRDASMVTKHYGQYVGIPDLPDVF